MRDVFENPEAEPTELFINPFACAIDPFMWRELQVHFYHSHVGCLLDTMTSDDAEPSPLAASTPQVGWDARALHGVREAEAGSAEPMPCYLCAGGCQERERSCSGACLTGAVHKGHSSILPHISSAGSY